MNLLAHAILSPPAAADAPAILAGNLVADWIKGKARHALPAPLQTGITLHRAIDNFTDTHPLVITTAELLAPNWGRYSTVLADIFFDHLLARNFHRYHPLPLRLFAQHTYKTANSFTHCLPDRANLALAAMTTDDWLTSYQTPAGIRLALTRMSTRLKHGIQLAPSVDDFLHHEPQFQAAFDQFFPLLKQHCRQHCHAHLEPITLCT
jgi:acyl carrier protein phosphodiesterase